MSLPAIQINNVSFAYVKGGPKAINHISLDFPQGQITALLGPNGAGKTTFLHLILGIIPALSGEIKFRGFPSEPETPIKISHLVGLVPQAEKSPLNFSVLEYVLLGRSPYISSLRMPGEEDHQKARAVLEQLELEHLTERLVPSLSGGEHQMVMIARALVQNTPILLLDEPTSHLDLGNKHKILSILKNLSRQGKTVIFTSHDPNEAAYAADHLVLIKAGELIQAGELKNVLTDEALQNLYNVNVAVETIRQHKVVVLE